MIRRYAKIVLITVLFGLIAACSRGPEPDSLRQHIQQRLDSVFGDGLLEIQSFKRYGSQPLAARSGDAGDRVAIYYKVALQLTRDHRFSDWTGQSISALHQALTAAEKGIEGVEAEGNRAGDVIYAHGLGVYRELSTGWAPVSHSASAGVDASDEKVGIVSEIDATDKARQEPPSWEQQFIDEFWQVSRAIDTHPEQRASTVLRSQLQAALTEARLNVLQSSGQMALVTGPKSGNYHRLGQGIELLMGSANEGITTVSSSGAIDNIHLLNRGLASLAFTQSDLAVAAFGGVGVFSGQQADNLRAVSALYPEPVQIVVRSEAGIEKLADLAGRQVNIGPDGTGTQLNAKQILALADVDHDDFLRLDINEAIGELRAGRLDAVFITSALPSQYLKGSTEGITLLPVPPQIVQALSKQSGYIPYRIPSGAYPGVEMPIETVAVTAMLVADVDTPPEQIITLLEGLFDQPAQLNQLGDRGGSIDKKHALSGITLPLHPAAAEYFSATE